MINTEMLTLDDIWSSINQQLTRAINDRKHPFRLAFIGTMGKDAANMRTVVLRKFHAEPFKLACYTDIRSQKVEELKAHPKLTWLFWNPKHQIQIKAIGSVTIEQQTEYTRQVWNNMHIGAKVAYLTRSAPSTPQNIPTNGLPKNINDIDENDLNDEYFSIIHCMVDTVEYLQLNRMQHRRAKFERQENEWKGIWLVP